MMIKSRLLVLFCCLFVCACGEGKVTDPNDPRFDPMNFSFRDYKGHEQFAEFARIHMPLGTDHAYVEKILVENAGGSKHEKDVSKIKSRRYGYKELREAAKKITADKEIKYGYPGITHGFTWSITAFYDENGKLVQMFARNVVVFNEEEQGE